MVSGRLLSVNVGEVGELRWRGQAYRTAIVKTPVEGPVPVRELGLDGDRQADPRVHGGPDKAVYLYPVDHYGFWKERLERDDLGPGSFGENLTVEGLSERALRVGDELEIGEARLQVTEPRYPCFKLAAHMERADMQKLFVQSERSGAYLRVLREGAVQEGDAVTLTRSDPEAPTILDVFRARTGR